MSETTVKQLTIVQKFDLEGHFVDNILLMANCGKKNKKLIMRTRIVEGEAKVTYRIVDREKDTTTGGIEDLSEALKIYSGK